MNISRRDVLKMGAGATAAWAGGVVPSWASVNVTKKIPIGLQLYSVRKDCAEDLPGVLKAVAEMGYSGVEFAGYHGRSAEELRKLLDANGLKCCGTHTGLPTLFPENLGVTIEFNKTLGNKYLIVPWLPEDKRNSVEAIKKTAAFFDECAAKVKEHGMVVGYHAHGGDFSKVDGDTTAWDMLFGSTKPEVVMQMDIGNCIDGGGDPYTTLEKFPGRSLTVHLKEHGGERGATVGEGEVDWERVFRICESVGATEWYIVEQEAYDGQPLDSVRKCIRNLRKMGK